MAKIVCGASKLKCDDYKYKNVSYFAKLCTKCELVAYDNIVHIIMPCPFHTDLRNSKYNELSGTGEWRHVEPGDTLEILLGVTQRETHFQMWFLFGVRQCSGLAKCILE